MWSACIDCEVSIYIYYLKRATGRPYKYKSACVRVDDNDVQYPRTGRRITVYEIKYNTHSYIYYIICLSRACVNFNAIACSGCLLDVPRADDVETRDNITIYSYTIIDSHPRNWYQKVFFLNVLDFYFFFILTSTHISLTSHLSCTFWHFHSFIPRGCEISSRHYRPLRYTVFTKYIM